MDAPEQFRQFIIGRCDTDPGPIMADGNWHRFRIADTRHKGSRPGRYLLHADERPTGIFMDLREGGEIGPQHKWFADGPALQIDRAELGRRRQERRNQLAQKFDRAAASAAAFWKKCTKPNGGSHPYLEAKGIVPHGARYGRASAFFEDAGDEPVLVIPLSDAAGSAVSLQAIRADGARRYWPNSTKEGAHFQIGKDDGSGPVIFCEGYSTAATIHDATGFLTIMCLDSGNMAAVSRWAAHKYSGRPMLVAGDDDWHLPLLPKPKPNAGREAALNMARNLGARAVFPNMHGLATDGGDDFNDMARELGHDEVLAVFTAALADTSRPPTPLPFEWYDEISPQLEANWLVEDLIPAASLCLVYGHPGSGKSFFALDMAMHIAWGRAWRDRAVQHGLVIYIGAEGQRGLRQRVAAFRQHHGVEEIPFGLIPVEVNLLAADGDLEKVADTIRIVARRFNLPVAMIVADTLSRTFGGGDEVGPDMVSYINNVGRLQAEFQATTLIVHHRPKDSANETPRGHGSLWGACDTIILVEDMSGPKTAKVTKQKDAETGNPVLFSLLVVELGEDEKGKPVTSCVVVPSDTLLLKTGASNRLSDGQQITLAQLNIAVEETGRFTDHGVPLDMLPAGPPVKVVRVSDWQIRTTCALSNPDKPPDTLRRTFQRYRERLQRLGFVGIYEDFAWKIK